MKVIFIAGLSRSGSKLLNTFLGKSHIVLALGELTELHSPDDLQKKLRGATCTCEDNADDCVFWQGFLDFLNKNVDSDYYEALLNYVKNKYPEKKIIVDSSKDINSMLHWVRLKKTIPNLKIYPVHLVRDVRGWLYSYDKRRPNISKFNNFIGIIRNCRSWYKQNKNFDSLINEYSENFLRIGYEEFIFYRKKTINLIFSYCDETNLISKYNSLSDSEAHELNNAPSRLPLRKTQEIKYDFFWMTNWFCSFLGIIFPVILNMNKKYVYGNLGKNKKIRHISDYE